MKIDLNKQLSFKNVHNDRVEMNWIGIFLNIPSSVFNKLRREDKWFFYQKRRRKFNYNRYDEKIFFSFKGNAIREGVNFYAEKLNISMPYAGVISEVEKNYVPPKVLALKSLERIYPKGRALLYQELCGCGDIILGRLHSRFKLSSTSFKIIKSLKEVESGIDIQVPIAVRDEFIDLIRENINRISTTSTFRYHDGDHTISTGGKVVKGSSWDVINETGDVQPAGRIEGVMFKVYEKAIFKGISLIRIEATFTDVDMERIIERRSFESEEVYFKKLEVLNRWAYEKFERLIKSESPMASIEDREILKTFLRSFLNKDIDDLVNLLDKKDRVFVGKNSGLSKYLKRKIPLLEKEGIFIREPGRGAWYRFNPKAFIKICK